MAEEITEILRRYGIFGVTVQPTQLTITSNTIMEATRSSQLSDAIFDHILPKLPHGKMYHFTSAEAALKIQDTRTLRLHQLSRRYDDGELRNFFAHFALPWYLGHERGEPRGLEIANDIFYLSLTPTTCTDSQQQDMAKRFGRGNPVRLTLEIAADADQRVPYYGLRGVRYFPSEAPAFDLYRECCELAKRYGRRFGSAKPTRASAYVLPDSLHSETEVRFAVRGSDYPALVRAEGSTKWLDLPLGSTTPFGLRIDLTATTLF